MLTIPFNLSVTQDSVRYQKILALLKNKLLMNTSQQVNTSSSAIFSSFQHSILTCKFQESACNLTQDFEAFFSSDFSYCFKFNSDMTNLKTITMPGALNGFQFSMYLDPMSSQFVNKRGLRVFIHNSTRKYPIKYIDIQPGVMANVALKKTVYEHLSQPYTNCIADLTANTEPQTAVMKYMFRNMSVISYSYSLCQAIVFSYNLVQECGCLETTFLKTEVNRLCFNSTQIDCMNKFRANFNEDISSECPMGKLKKKPSFF